MNGWKVSAAAPKNSNVANDNKYTGLSTRQEEKRKEKQRNEDYGFTNPPSYPNRIAIMLDLQGTLDGLDDEKTKQLSDYFHFLRRKYAVKEVVVSVMTYANITELKKYTDILKKNFGKNIKLGNCYTLDREFDPYTNQVYRVSALDKLAIFEKNYVDEFTTWFGVIDDGISPETITRYKESRPMALFRPSQRFKSALKYDNVMCYSTMTKGIDGVLEILQSYCDRLVNTSANKLFEEQQNCLLHPSSSKIRSLCKNRDYSMLARYMTETTLDEDDYETIMNHILSVGELINKEELNSFKKIVSLVQAHMAPKNAVGMSLLKDVIGI